jgi:hypothetical protein
VQVVQADEDLVQARRGDPVVHGVQRAGGFQQRTMGTRPSTTRRTARSCSRAGEHRQHQQVGALRQHRIDLGGVPACSGLTRTISGDCAARA